MSDNSDLRYRKDEQTSVRASMRPGGAAMMMKLAEKPTRFRQSFFRLVRYFSEERYRLFSDPAAGCSYSDLFCFGTNVSVKSN